MAATVAPRRRPPLCSEPLCHWAGCDHARHCDRTDVTRRRDGVSIVRVCLNHPQHEGDHLMGNPVDDTITATEALSLIASVFDDHSPRRVLRDRLPELLNLVTPPGKRRR